MCSYSVLHHAMFHWQELDYTCAHSTILSSWTHVDMHTHTQTPTYLNAYILKNQNFFFF